MWWYLLDRSSIKQFHKLDGMNEQWATEFGLNHAQMRFVQDAIPGNDEKGYSQALLGVDGEWRGMEVRALSKERHVIENEVDLMPDLDVEAGSSAETDDD